MLLNGLGSMPPSSTPTPRFAARYSKSVPDSHPIHFPEKEFDEFAPRNIRKSSAGREARGNTFYVTDETADPLFTNTYQNADIVITSYRAEEKTLQEIQKREEDLKW